MAGYKVSHALVVYHRRLCRTRKTGFPWTMRSRPCSSSVAEVQVVQSLTKCQKSSPSSGIQRTVSPYTIAATSRDAPAKRIRCAVQPSTKFWRGVMHLVSKSSSLRLQPHSECLCVEQTPIALGIVLEPSGSSVALTEKVFP